MHSKKIVFLPWLILLSIAGLAGVLIGEYVLNNSLPYNLIGSVLLLFAAVLLYAFLKISNFKKSKHNVQIKLGPIQISVLIIGSILLGLLSGHTYLSGEPGNFQSILQTDIF